MFPANSYINKAELSSTIQLGDINALLMIASAMCCLVIDGVVELFVCCTIYFCWLFFRVEMFMYFREEFMVV